MRLTEKEEKTVIMEKREEKTALKDEALEKAAGGAAGAALTNPAVQATADPDFPDVQIPAHTILSIATGKAATIRKNDCIVIYGNPEHTGGWFHVRCHPCDDRYRIVPSDFQSMCA